jgi:hypothetical protein
VVDGGLRAGLIVILWSDMFSLDTFHDMLTICFTICQSLCMSPDLDGSRGTTKMCPERPTKGLDVYVTFDTFVFIESQH